MENQKTLRAPNAHTIPCESVVQSIFDNTNGLCSCCASPVCGLGNAKPGTSHVNTTLNQCGLCNFSQQGVTIEVMMGWARDTDTTALRGLYEAKEIECKGNPSTPAALPFRKGAPHGCCPKRYTQETGSVLH